MEKKKEKEEDRGPPQWKPEVHEPRCLVCWRYYVPADQRHCPHCQRSSFCKACIDMHKASCARREDARAKEEKRK